MMSFSQIWWEFLKRPNTHTHKAAELKRKGADAPLFIETRLRMAAEAPVVCIYMQLCARVCSWVCTSMQLCVCVRVRALHLFRRWQRDRMFIIWQPPKGENNVDTFLFVLLPAQPPFPMHIALTGMQYWWDISGRYADMGQWVLDSLPRFEFQNRKDFSYPLLLHSTLLSFVSMHSHCTICYSIYYSSVYAYF